MTFTRMPAVTSGYNRYHFPVSDHLTCPATNQAAGCGRSRVRNVDLVPGTVCLLSYHCEFNPATNRVQRYVAVDIQATGDNSRTRRQLQSHLSAMLTARLRSGRCIANDSRRSERVRRNNQRYHAPSSSNSEPAIARAWPRRTSQRSQLSAMQSLELSQMPVVSAQSNPAPANQGLMVAPGLMLVRDANGMPRYQQVSHQLPAAQAAITSQDHSRTAGRVRRSQSLGAEQSPLRFHGQAPRAQSQAAGLNQSRSRGSRGRSRPNFCSIL